MASPLFDASTTEYRRSAKRKSLRVLRVLTFAGATDYLEVQTAVEGQLDTARLDDRAFVVAHLDPPETAEPAQPIQKLAGSERDVRDEPGLAAIARKVAWWDTPERTLTSIAGVLAPSFVNG